MVALAPHLGALSMMTIAEKSLRFRLLCCIRSDVCLVCLDHYTFSFSACVSFHGEKQIISFFIQFDEMKSAVGWQSS